MSSNRTAPVSVQPSPFQAGPAQRRTPMAEEDPQQPESGAEGLPGLLPGLQGAEASALQLRIKNSICKSVQSKVENILQDVEKFSDIEKLYLYLKLPTGPSSSAEKSEQSALSSSRTQQMHAFSWIRDHLEEYPETSLPKQEVYDEYKSFCDNLNYHPLSAADFGKMMKNVFPNMKARRLGMRGKSKYCYSGLRKRPFVHMSSLPTLDLHKSADGLQCDTLESPCLVSGIKEEVRFAACDLVCEWAQKVLKRQFDAVEDLARFLMDSHYISNKSLAALTLMTGAATEVRPQQTISAFAPTADPQPFQPQGKMFSSPSIDAKQQLQRKIQRKQQEQKMQSPLLGEEQAKRTLDSAARGSPGAPSPQPTIGIVVTAVSSPLTVPKSGQLMSPSPVGTVESKVLPINFQMVSQPVQVVKQSPKPTQSNLSSPAGERLVRQRYAQILPKPSATSGLAMRSPSAMIIANSPIKTVMTTCQVSPVSLVKMTAISLAPNSAEMTSLTNAALRPASAGVTSAAVVDVGSTQNIRSTAQNPVTGPGQSTNTQSLDVEMEVEAIHMNSQRQSPSSQVLSQEGTSNRAVGTVHRAASVPIPHTKGFLGLEEALATRGSGNSSSGANSAVKSIGNSSDKAGALHFISPNLNTSSLSLGNTSRLSSCGEGSQAEEGLLSTKSFRKRCGLSPDLSPVKRVFMPHQPAEGAGFVPGHGASGRPESAPASRELEMKMSSVFSAQAHPQCSSPFFDSVAKIQSSMQGKNTPTVMETGPTVNDASMQEQRGRAVSSLQALTDNPGYQNHANSTAYQSSPAANPLQFVTSNPLAMQEHMDYFTFDDDVTQDSIVEELVQMEEQMKLKHLQELGSCGPLQGQPVMTPSNVTSTNQSMSGFYPAPNSGSLIHTPTPTSEMMGGVSPCPRMASTTPVDSALGSSRHTPIGTPHSNCSSTVPPSPVECRNPFAFTPINSSMTCFHDSSPVSSSPVKPMQRPTATHPDKARLEWMNNSYGGSGGSNKSNSGMGILTGYRGLTDEPFQKPHAFAVPHARHHDSHCGRLTPISPVQQPVANMNRQEGFAVPAPLDNKASNASSAMFRCRSVSPAVHQRNLSVNVGGGAPLGVPRSVASPFNSPVTPEVLNIFTNREAGLGAGSMAQRSRSVPLNIMMQTEVQQCSGISSILLGKLEGDHDDALRGLGMQGVPPTYTARMNLTQMLESKSTQPCSDAHLSMMASNSTSSHGSQQPGYLIEHKVREQMSLSASSNQTQSAMLSLSSHQQEQLDFRSAQQQQQLLTGPLIEQVSELTAGGADFPCEIRMTSELSGSINDLNSLDTNLLFNPSQQQSRFHSSAAEELSDQLFQQISDTPHSAGLDWLESKDHPAVGLMG